MSRILAVGSPKGGVGKTTTAVTLAAIASRGLGLRVLLVDADDNRSALDWTTRASEATTPFDVVAGTEHGELAQLRRGRHHDLTVVDLPGAREGAFATILRGSSRRPVADLLLVPARAEVMDLRPVARVIRGEIAPLDLPYLLVLDLVHALSVPRAHHQAADLRNHGLSVAETVIRHYSTYGEAVERDRTILDIGGGRHSYARAAEADYRALAREAFAHLGLDTSALGET